MLNILASIQALAVPPSAGIELHHLILSGMDEEKLVAWHRTRAKALLEAGCDLFACETVQEPQECQSAPKWDTDL